MKTQGKPSENTLILVKNSFFPLALEEAMELFSPLEIITDMCDTPPILIETDKFTADTHFQNSKYLSAIQIEMNLNRTTNCEGI
jgi:hypothetical protein